jgi:hypothetical protein
MISSQSISSFAIIFLQYAGYYKVTIIALILQGYKGRVIPISNKIQQKS